MEYEEQIDSDVQNEASSELQDTSAQTGGESQEAEQSLSKETPKPEPEQTPFHEHPRFKELVDQKNRYAEQARALEDKYTQLTQQMSEMTKKMSPSQEDALIAELKQIRPEFGNRFEQIWNKVQKMDEVINGQDQLRQQAFVTQANSEIKQLHAEFKTDAELQPHIYEKLDNAYRNGQIKSLEDVRSVYKVAHEGYSKWIDSIKRSTTQSYVTQKKADSAKPSVPKGKGVPNAKPGDFSKDPGEARQQLIRRVLSGAKADSDL